MDRQTHWNHVYSTKAPDEVSWYQADAVTSMRLIQTYADRSASVLDVGAGTSRLADALLDAGFARPIALDISADGLARAKKRLGERASLVQWIVADLTADPPLPLVDVWHDRAALHFLTTAEEQRSYARLATKTLRTGGHAVIGTFALDGPDRCSGLPVQRHDGKSVLALLGSDFDLVHEEKENHRTPRGVEQAFQWSVLRRR